GAPELLFTHNETNFRRLQGLDVPGPCKDAFHDRVVGGDRSAVSTEPRGTKLAAWYRQEGSAGGRWESRLRRCRKPLSRPLDGFAALFERRRAEADEFYARVQAGIDGEEERRIQRQAFAGLVWSKQYYGYDVPRWLAGDPAQPPPPAARRHGRNWEWQHLTN